MMGVNNNFINILLIENDPDNKQAIQVMLKDALREYNSNSLQIQLVDNCDDALLRIDNNCYDVVLLDLALSESKGIDEINKFKEYLYKTPFIVLSGIYDRMSQLALIRQGIQDYLIKGTFNSNLLLNSIIHSIERHRLMMLDKKLILHDELTGLYNRRGFYHLVEQQIKIAKRKNQAFLLFYIDLDNFKFINDNFGHQEGDKILKEAADLLKKTFRSADIIARIGGDEFIVFLFESRINQAKFIIKRILNNTKKYNEIKDNKYQISMSIGYSVFNPENPTNIDSLINIADRQMYINKKSKEKN